MQITLRRSMAAGAAFAVVGGLMSFVAAPASAAVIGTIIGPTSGNTTTPFSVKASASCPAQATSYVGYINGNGWGTDAVVAVSAAGDMAAVASSLNVADTLSGLALSNGVPLTDGTYTFVLRCSDDFGVADFGTFESNYTVAGSTFAFETPAAPASTTTLTGSPAPGTLLQGAPITLSAAVSSTATVAGTVQFKDGATNLGAPVAVSAGAASLVVNTSASPLTGGSHAFTAQFIPTTPTAIAGSVSAAITYTVNAPATATTTTLTGPATATTADLVPLTATVAPANAVGSVTFKEGATTLGTATVSGGVASFSLNGVTAGTHNYTADFVPANPSNFVASSGSFSLDVTAFAGVQASENLTTTVAAGALTITAGGADVDLGTLALNSTNTLLESAPKDINTVTVTDGRAGSQGWNVNGIVGDFVSGANKINSANLGWTPRVLTVGSGQTVTAGAAVAPAAGVAVTSTSTDGLKSARLLATSPAGSSVGTSTLSAALLLKAPTTTQAGVYNTVLTLTAI